MKKYNYTMMQYGANVYSRHTSTKYRHAFLKVSVTKNVKVEIDKQHSMLPKRNANRLKYREVK